MKENGKTLEDNVVSFSPSRVEGLENISHVAIYPDRMELKSDCELHVFQFMGMMKWLRFAWFYKALYWFGFGIYGFPCVAERDWFCPPRDRFFCFYTNPRITVYMPEDEGEMHDGYTFSQIKSVLSKGGFNSFDSG